MGLCRKYLGGTGRYKEVDASNRQRAHSTDQMFRAWDGRQCSEWEVMGRDCRVAL